MNINLWPSFCEQKSTWTLIIILHRQRSYVVIKGVIIFVGHPFLLPCLAEVRDMLFISHNYRYILEIHLKFSCLELAADQRSSERQHGVATRATHCMQFISHDITMQSSVDSRRHNCLFLSTSQDYLVTGHVDVISDVFCIVASMMILN